MATPPGRPHLISSQTLGAHVPRRLVALLDTIARADHISREHVVRRALVSEIEQHKRRSRRDRPRRPTTRATFDAEIEAQLAAIVANIKPGRRQLIGGQTLGRTSLRPSSSLSRRRTSRPMTRSLADASSPCSTRSRARTTSAAGKWSSGRSSARLSSTFAELCARSQVRPPYPNRRRLMGFVRCWV